MEQLANNPVTTLNGAINNSTTSVVVTSATGFSTTGNFVIRVESELMRVTSVSSNTFTVSRGAEGTTAASHADLTPVNQVVSNNVMAQLYSEMCQVGVSASRPSTVRAGTEYIASDLGNVSWKYDGTNWNLNKPVYMPYANRIDVSSWTDANATGVTYTDYNGVSFVTVLSSAGDNLRIKYKAKPSAPFNAYLAHGTNPLSQSHSAVGLVLYDSGTTKAKYVIYDGNDTGALVKLETWNSLTSFNANVSGTSNLVNPAPVVYMRFQDDNTNFNYYFSYDATNWIKFYSETRNTFCTPDKIGIGFYKDNTWLSGSTAPHSLYGYWEN